MVGEPECLPLGGDKPPAGFESLGAIDRIGEDFCESAHDPVRLERIQRYRAFRLRCIGTTLGFLEASGLPHRAAVSIRLKRLDSIRRQIARPGTNFSLGRLDDVVGVRVVCQDFDAARELSARIAALPEVVRTKDYIDNPPENTGYRGIHHILRFDQKVTEGHDLNVRFEVQVRSYYQHLWAIYSEEKGIAAKAGQGSDDEHDELRLLSTEIAHLESSDPAKMQTQRLPQVSKLRTIGVCWRVPEGGGVLIDFFDDAQEAVDWLNYLETSNPAERGDALLLVGVTELHEAENLLRLTHPRYAGRKVYSPRDIIPELASDS